MKPIERIKKIIEYSELSISSFEKHIGASNNSIQIALKRKTSVKDETLNRVLDRFPEINPSWLLTGNGEMFLSHSKSIPAYSKVTSEMAYNSMVNEKAAEYLKTDVLLKEKDIRINELKSQLEDKERYIKLLEKQLNI